MVSRSSRLWLTGSLAVAACWVLYRFPPATTAWYPRCLFHMMTGLDCPGCGGTRALHQLLHGNVAEAFLLNPLLFLYLLPVAVFAAPGIIRGHSPAFLAKPWFGWTSVVVVTAFWVGRNLV